MSRGHCHCRKDAATQGRRRGNGARGGSVVTADGKMGGAEGGRGQGWVRRRSASGGRGHPWTTALMTPSRGGTHRSTSPEAGVIRLGGPWGEEGTTVKVEARGRLPLTVKTTRGMPHPLRRCCCCRCHCCRPPLGRSMSREERRRPPTLTSTPYLLTRRTSLTWTTTGPWWR